MFVKNNNRRVVGAIDGKGTPLSHGEPRAKVMRAGESNQRIILQSIRLAPGITRFDLAQQTGLTVTAVGNITSRLMQQGLVCSSGRRNRGRGQPALQLEVVSSGAFGLGLNIERDCLTLVTLDLTGEVRSRVTREMPISHPDDVRTFVLEELDDLLVAGGVVRDRVLGLGIAISDDIHRTRMSHLHSAYDAWSMNNLRKMFASALPWPVYCDNDAVTAALAEAGSSAECNVSSFFYLLISAGLGGGMVFDQCHNRGATPRPSAIGLMPDLSSKEGAIVQDIVSVSALVARLEAAGLNELPLTALADPSSAAASVLSRWVDDVAQSLVRPVSAITYLFNPDVVLIGGRLPTPLILKITGALPGAFSTLNIPLTVRIQPALIAKDPSAIGAAILPFLSNILPSTV